MRYQQLFDDKLKVLGSYFDDLFAADNRCLFFGILAKEIIPMIIETKAIQPFLLALTNQFDDYNERYNQLNQCLSDKLDTIIIDLSETLKKESYLSNAVLKEYITKRDCPFDVTVKAKLNWLDRPCCIIAQLGRFDLIKDCVDIRFFNESVCHIKDKNVKCIIDCKFTKDCKGCVVKTACVTSFAFSKDISDLYALQDQFLWDKVSDAFVAWQYLKIAMECYNNSDALLKKEDFSLSLAQWASKVSCQMLFEEMSIIKRKKSVNTNGDTTFLFTVKRFQSYCKIFINALLRYQVKGDSNLIESLRLFQRNLDLYLEVKLSTTDTVNTYLVHKFHDSSVPHQYFNQSLENIGKKIDTRDLACSKNYPIAKLWKRINLPKKLLKLFFEQENAFITVCKENPIVIRNRMNVDHETLMSNINKLTKVDQIF